jgi:hypothetical protein
MQKVGGAMNEVKGFQFLRWLESAKECEGWRKHFDNKKIPCLVIRDTTSALFTLWVLRPPVEWIEHKQEFVKCKFDFWNPNYEVIG